MLKTEINEIKSWKKEVAIEVEADALQPAIQKTIQDYRRKANLPGFRKGKAPLSLVLKRFGDSIRADVTEEAIRSFLAQAVQEHEVPVVAVQEIRVTSPLSLEDSIPFAFKADVQVRPEISIGHYKGFKVEKEIQPVHDEDVEEVLRMLREQNARYDESDSGAQSGDIIECDIQALDPSGVPVIGQKWEDRALMLGQPPLGPGVEEQLTGIKPGENRPFVMDIPSTEQNPTPSRQAYSIHAKKVKERKLPELDEAFAQKVGQVDSVPELTERIRTNLKMQHEENAEKRLRHRIADEILKKNDFELPPAMIEESLQSLWERYQGNPQADPRVDEKQFKEENRAGVIWNLKWEMIWREIAEEESLTVSEDTVDEEIDKAALANPKDEKKIRALFKNPQRRSGLKDQMLEEETLRFLKEHIKIKEVQIKKSKSKKSSIITP